MALQDPRVEPGPVDPECGLFPVHANADPLARVTLVDLRDGSMWQIDYKVQSSPLMATETSGLTSIPG